MMLPATAARALGRPVTIAAVAAPSPSEERRAFEAVNEAAASADEDDNWDTFLDAAAQTMEEFPERKSRHARRAEIADWSFVRNRNILL